MDALGGGQYRIQLDQGDTVIRGKLSGRMRRFRIRVLPGDPVVAVVADTAAAARDAADLVFVDYDMLDVVGDVAVGVRRQIADHFAEKPFPGGLTYNSHTLACAAAVATIGVYESDGLIERRGAPLDVGFERLEASARRHAGADPDALADSILGDLTDGIDIADDVIVVNRGRLVTSGRLVEYEGGGDQPLVFDASDS